MFLLQSNPEKGVVESTRQVGSIVENTEIRRFIQMCMSAPRFFALNSPPSDSMLMNAVMALEHRLVADHWNEWIFIR